MKKSTRLIVAAVITLLIAAVAYYIVLPPANIASPEFWISLTFVTVVYGAVYLLLTLRKNLFDTFKGKAAKEKTGRMTTAKERG